MNTVSHLSAFPATGLVPVLPTKPKPIDDDRLAVEIELLRRRQLRREDVRELLLRRAEAVFNKRGQPSLPDSGRWLTINEFCRLTGLTKYAIRKARIERGIHLRRYRIGREHLVRPVDGESFLRELAGGGP